MKKFNNKKFGKATYKTINYRNLLPLTQLGIDSTETEEQEPKSYTKIKENLIKLLTNKNRLTETALRKIKEQDILPIWDGTADDGSIDIDFKLLIKLMNREKAPIRNEFFNQKDKIVLKNRDKNKHYSSFKCTLSTYLDPGSYCESLWFYLRDLQIKDLTWYEDQSLRTAIDEILQTHIYKHKKIVFDIRTNKLIIGKNTYKFSKFLRNFLIKECPEKTEEEINLIDSLLQKLSTVRTKQVHKIEWTTDFVDFMRQSDGINWTSCHNEFKHIANKNTLGRRMHSIAPYINQGLDRPTTMLLIKKQNNILARMSVFINQEKKVIAFGRAYPNNQYFRGYKRTINDLIKTCEKKGYEWRVLEGGYVPSNRKWKYAYAPDLIQRRTAGTPFVGYCDHRNWALADIKRNKRIKKSAIIYSDMEAINELLKGEKCHKN